MGDSPVQEVTVMPVPAFAGQTLAHSSNSNQNEECRQANYNALAIHLKTSIRVLLIT
jgi:hypothetical protein